MLNWIKLRKDKTLENMKTFTAKNSRGEVIHKITPNRRTRIGEFKRFDVTNGNTNKICDVYMLSYDWYIMYKEEGEDRFYSAFKLTDCWYVDEMQDMLGLNEVVIIDMKRDIGNTGDIWRKLISRQEKLHDLRGLFSYSSSMIETEEGEDEHFLVDSQCEGYIKLNNVLYIVKNGFYSWGSAYDNKYTFKASLLEELEFEGVSKHYIMKAYIQLYGMSSLYDIPRFFLRNSEFTTQLVSKRREGKTTLEAINHMFCNGTNEVGYYRDSTNCAGLTRDKYAVRVTNSNGDSRYYLVIDSREVYSVTREQLITFCGCDYNWFEYDNYTILEEIVERVCKYYTFDELLKGVDRIA